MAYAAAAVERAMTYQQVIMRALAGSLTWLQAADILGIAPRSLRRWRARYERDPVVGLLDCRRRRPSHRVAPRAEVQRILQLYRTRYQGFNVRHFHHLARRDHGVTLSYTFVRLALQAAGLVPKRRARGRHRRRREPRPCFGELLHLDGSPHAWLTLRPGERQTLIAVVDDATKRLLYAQLWPAGRSTLRRRAAPSPATSSRTWAAPSPGSASNTSAPTRRRRAAEASASTAPCRTASSRNSSSTASPPSRPPTTTCRNTSSRTTTPPSPAPPRTPPLPSSPSAMSTSSRSCAKKPSAWSLRTIP